MKIEFLNQKGTFDFDIQKKLPLVWTETEEGKHVDEFSIKPVKGQIEGSADEVVIDTGDLPVTWFMELIQAMDEMDEKERIKHHKSRANYAAGYDDEGKPYAIELKKNTEITH